MGARDPFADLPDASAIVAGIWREYLAPPPDHTVTEWAEANVVLSSKDSAEPGPYRVSRTPYVREPQDCLSANSPVEEITLIWGAQTSKTRLGLNWMAYTADVNPGPFMAVQPTIDMGKRFSRQRVAPMIDESAALRRKVKENRSRDDAATTLLKEYPGGFWCIAGANSAAGLRSMPVRDLFLDEIDGYPYDVDGEGDPCALAEARQTTFARRKRLKTSTPTTRDLSRIEAAYLGTDQCRYHVPCPHCGEFQPLDWGADTPYGIRWDRKPDGSPDPDTVRYVCRANGCEIREHHKPQMLAGGRWVAANPGADPRRRGFQLSSLYSPLGWLSWAELADEWHKAQRAAKGGDVGLLRVFINTRLAETFEEAGDKVAAHELARRAEDWPLGTVPRGGLILVQSVDVQGNRLEASTWAYGRGEESWLVDVRIFHGDPGLPEDDPHSPWAALTAWRRTPVNHAGGAPMRAIACGIDSGGHHAERVYAYARRYAHEHVLALKGASQSNRPILGKPTDLETNHQGKRLKRGVRLWPVGTDTAKAVIYSRLRLQDHGPGYVHFSRGTPHEFYDQLTAERLHTKMVKGRPKLEWIKPSGRRNEGLDLAVYALAMTHYIGLPRYKEGDWTRLEARFGQRSLWGDGDTAAAALTDRGEATPQDLADPAPPPTIDPDNTLPPASPPGGSLAEPAPPQPAAPPAPAPRPAAPRMRRPGAFGIKRW